MNIKLDEPSELMFIMQACDNCNIKAKDAPMVAKVMVKLRKMYEKLEQPAIPPK